MTQTDKLRIAVWGTGNMAKKHLNSALESGRCELVAIAARNHAAAQGICDEHKRSDIKIVNDPLSLLGTCDFDALICAIPPGLQTEQAAQIAAAGKHLFLEKPVALHIDQVQAIADAASKAQVQTQICHHFRFDPAIQWLKQQIENGGAGTPCQFLSRFWMNGDMSSWWKSPSLGGGQVIEQLIHQFDLARYLFGEAQMISGFWATLVKNKDPEYFVDDNSVCNIQFKNGALANISGSNCAAPMRWIGDWRIVCEQLVLDATDDGDWRTPSSSSVQWRKDLGEISETFKRDYDLHQACLINWLDAIDNKATCLVPIQDAVATHKLVFAAAESMRQNGTPINL